jgi:hypothetical protein
MISRAGAAGGGHDHLPCRGPPWCPVVEPVHLGVPVVLADGGDRAGGAQAVFEAVREGVDQAGGAAGQIVMQGGSGRGEGGGELGHACACGQLLGLGRYSPDRGPQDRVGVWVQPPETVGERLVVVEAELPAPGVGGCLAGSGAAKLHVGAYAAADREPGPGQ